MLGAGLLAGGRLNLLNEHFGSLGTHLVGGHLHGSHGGLQHAAYLMTGETDDAHLLGDAVAPLRQGADSAQTLHIHGGDDGVELTVVVEQLVCALVAVFKAVDRLLAGAEILCQIQLGHRPLVAVEPQLVGGQMLGTVDHADLPAALFI